MCEIRVVSFIFVSILLVIMTSAEVSGHCHNDDPTENLLQDLISGDRWDEPGSPETVKYYIGTFPGPASLTVNVNWAASQWSNVQFENETVNFRLNYTGTTNRTVPYKDGWNVVDWGPDVWHQQANVGVPGRTFRWISPSNPDQLVEVDLLFNYYAPFAPHQDPPNFPSDKICLRNIATHEFGHWVRLKDVGWQSSSYVVYTMFNQGSMFDNPHMRESLECEDKYGLWYTYNEMTWSAPPLLAEPDVVNLANVEAIGVYKTKLLQNYPGPFNPETWIPYELAEDSDVVLEIHNSKGYLVRKLVLGSKSKGRYLEKRNAAYWDGRNEKGEFVPSGVYFYTLKADDFSATRKMILLK